MTTVHNDNVLRLTVALAWEARRQAEGTYGSDVSGYWRMQSVLRAQEARALRLRDFPDRLPDVCEEWGQIQDNDADTAVLRSLAFGVMQGSIPDANTAALLILDWQSGSLEALRAILALAHLRLVALLGSSQGAPHPDVEPVPLRQIGPATADALRSATATLKTWHAARTA